MVKLTIIESRCRMGYFKKGDEYIVGDKCPPICHELWNAMYPSVYVLLNGGKLDCGEHRLPMFDIKCPDSDRVVVRGETL